ncbi:MAG TPA: metallothionein [Kiritimatiellia bacterium]|nr:metallothionein [Kiritimatiellia bacterium]
MAMKKKCACRGCVCKVDEKTAIKKNGKLYCSPHCADGHKTQKGCGHAGCMC